MEKPICPICGVPMMEISPDNWKCQNEGLGPNIECYMAGLDADGES